VDGVGNISNAGTSSMIIIDSTALSAPSGFAASASADSINLSWTNPVSDFDSVSIRRSSSGYPSTVAEGESVTSGSTGNSYSNTSLSVGTYYYSIFAYDSYGNISAAAHATATITPPELNIVVTAPSFENIALNDNLQFQVTVSNETSQNSENAEVTFTLSENLEFVSAEITLIEAVTASSLDPKSNRRISRASTAICSGSDTIVCNIGTVNAGQTVSLSVTTRVTTAGAISFSAANSGGVSADSVSGSVNVDSGGGGCSLIASHRFNVRGGEISLVAAMLGMLVALRFRRFDKVQRSVFSVNTEGILDRDSE
jgi:uncharacterized repeat protein (TIGR01451 family)